MALVLESGSAVANANSYASEDTADTYHEDRGNTTWTAATSGKEEALIRASAAIDATYRNRFPGYRVKNRGQGLEWPRAVAYDVSGIEMVSTEVPTEIVQATCEAALRELITPGSMMPDLERGGAIQSIQAGSVAITYAGNAEVKTTYSIIGGLLNGILLPGSGGGLFGTAVRG